MRRVAVAVLVAGCGRIAFDPLADSSPSDVGLDAGPSVLGVYGAGGGDWARAAASMPNGDYVVAGQYASAFELGGAVLPYLNGLDTFVMRLDPEGRIRWVRTINGDANETPLGISVDAAGNIYVAGNLDGLASCGGPMFGTVSRVTAFACSWDPGGTLRWSHAFGGSDPGSPPQDVAWDIKAFGNVAVIVGNVRDNVDFGGGVTTPVGAGADGFVVVVDSATGSFVRAQRYGSTMDLIPHVVEIDSNAIYVAGRFTGDAMLNGTMVNQGGTDAFVMSLDAQLGFQWTFAFGGAGDELINGSAINSAALFVVGSVSSNVMFGTTPLTPTGSPDAYAASLTLLGAPSWARTLGASGCASFSHPSLHADTLLVPGGFLGTGTFAGASLVGGADRDGLIVAYDASGAERWAATEPVAGTSALSAVADAGHPTVLAVGYQSSADPSCGGGSVFAERDLELSLVPRGP